jgi:two-component system CheB/CheR fusion protein
MLPRLLTTPNVDMAPLKGQQTQAAVHGYGAAHREALESNAPPSILVDEEQKILHLSESAGRYLAPSGGPLSTSLAHLARPELRLDIRSGLHRALERGETSLSLPIPVQFNGAPHRVFVQVRPATPSEDGRPRAIVFFLEGGTMDAAPERAEGSLDHDLLTQMQQELQLTRDRLRASREEFEAANEELRAANEELQSINEEYRSTAEELETSKEELQSMNEELQTLNSELKMKLEGVSRAHSDLQNLMAATEVGTLFLDTGLRINRFTPSLADLFSVTPSDEGRPITDFTHRLKYTSLEADARAVLKDLAPIEREVESEPGRWFLMRLRPYRTLDDRIDGVVATFVDVTERKLSEQRLQTLTAELDHRVKNVLARVLALARITRAGGRPAERSLEVFEKRIQSMAQTHELLSHGKWSGARLERICEVELAPYRTGDNISISGPSIMLNPDGAQAVTLVLHELTTNAAKHGALTTPKGKVSIAISSSGDTLSLLWQESGGPKVSPPAQLSYGANVIKNLVKHELGGNAELEFNAAGVRCRIKLPLSKVQATAPPAP